MKEYVPFSGRFNPQRVCAETESEWVAPVGYPARELHFLFYAENRYEQPVTPLI